jgi:glycosyltransferase involved in cell wall biosynthesis
MAQPFDVSVVIPAFNSAAEITQRLSHLTAALERLDRAFEVIIVDDGSSDDTPRLLAGIDDPRMRVLTHRTNMGKFAALRTGMATTRGDACVFTDADLPYDLDVLPVMVDLVSQRGFHIAVGDRTLSGSRYSAELSLLRRLATRGFSTSTRLLFTGELPDTQCGLKAFRGDVARLLFPLVQEDGFAGDVELLYIALKYNLALRRVPVRLVHQGNSSVKAFRHAPGMLASMAGLRSRYRHGAYESPALRALVQASYRVQGNRCGSL